MQAGRHVTLRVVALLVTLEKGKLVPGTLTLIWGQGTPLLSP